MNILEKVLLWILYSSFIATIMTIFILVLKKLFKNYISPRLQHSLWFLVLIKLLLPVTIGSPLNLIPTISESYKNIVGYEKSDLTQSFLHSSESNYDSEKDSKEYLTSNISTSNNTSNENNNGQMYEENTLKNNFFKIEKILYDFKEKESDSIEKSIKISSYVWISGFIVMSTFVLLVIFKFKRNTNHFYKNKNPQIDNILEVSKKKLSLSKDISIYYSNEFKSPFIYGILNPKIYIPKEVLDISTDQELLHIILHELTHYKRKDLWCNLFSIMALSIHWFNPVIWFAMKKMREDRELACDSYILEILQEEESIQYGMTILNLSKVSFNNNYKSNLNLCFYESKTQIERRIMMIRKFKKGSYKMSVASIILLTLSGSLALASGGNIINTNIGSSINQNLENKENGDFKLYSPNETLLLETLDRVYDFVDFEFKVPTYLPSEYGLSYISMDTNIDEKLHNIVSFKYRKGDNYSNDFSFLVSKEDLIPYLKYKYRSYTFERTSENGTDNVVATYSEEPMTISNIDGVSMTIKRDYEFISHSEESKNEKSRYIIKYFICEIEGVWYAMEYYDKLEQIAPLESQGKKGSEFSNEFSKHDIKQTLLSLKNSKSILEDAYTSIDPDSKKTIMIYNEKDLMRAKEKIGFAPKFLLNLPGNLVADSSSVTISGTPTYGDPNAKSSKDFESILLFRTFYKQKYDSSVSGDVVIFVQGENTYYYNFLERELKKSDSDEIKKLNAKSIIVNGSKVISYPQKDKNENIESQCYIWKQDGIINELSVNVEVENHEEIIKAFMN